MSEHYPTIRLFVEHHLQVDAHLECEEAQSHYLQKVMRLKEGDRVALFNGSQGEWCAQVTALRKKVVVLEVQTQLRAFLPPPDVTLCFAPIKFGRIDYLIQKATELGVAKLQPVLTDYTQADRVNETRLRANAIEAAEQCERVEVPIFLPPIGFKHMVADWPADMPLYFGDEGGDGLPPQRWLATKPEGRWALLVGPEGGFSPTERAHLYGLKSATGVSLGPRILRADTAAIAMLALTQASWGDWHIAPHFRSEGTIE